MAIRAVISNDQPTPTAQVNEIWVGSFGVEGDEGTGLTTAAILSFFPDLVPGTWYRLAEFAEKVAAIDWARADDIQWTSLQIKQSTINGDIPVAIDLRIVDAVKTLCLAAAEHLSCFSNKNVWVWFE